MSLKKIKIAGYKCSKCGNEFPASEVNTCDACGKKECPECAGEDIMWQAGFDCTLCPKCLLEQKEEKK